MTYINNLENMKTIYKEIKTNIFQSTIKFLSVLAFINLVGCSTDDGCAYDINDSTACSFTPTNTKLSGWTVATCYGKGTNPIGVIYDTSQNSTAPLGDDWGRTLDPTPPTSPKAIHPASWNSDNLGQVFGIAIDDSENVFLSTSGIYNQLGFNYDNGVKSATIYKSSSSVWNATSFVQLPTSTGNLNDIGNIAYDKKNNQLFATNLEDGKIYRITGLNNTLGTIAGVYDPWSQDLIPSPSGEVIQDERVWGIGVNYEGGKVKVYFPRITSARTREIYSITLNNDGSFPVTTSEIIEITGVPGNELVISDLAFSGNTNEMLISERGDPHRAKVLSYSRTGTTWNFNKQYFVGSSVGENSAGGVDFAYKEQDGDISAGCDDFFWASGNYMEAINYPTPPAGPPFLNGKIYGLQGISYGGNQAYNSTPSGTGNEYTDIFIDLDPGADAKGGIGDVEVFDANKCFVDLCNQ